MATFLFAPTPNQEAANFIKSKPAITRTVFDKLLPELKPRAFTIAGIQAADVLQRARDLVAKLPAGGDWEDIKKDLIGEITPYFVDEDASAEDQAGQQRAAERRAELLIRTHGQQAYSAAQYGILNAQRDLFPFWQYTSLGDDHVRPEHAALDGVVLPADHEFWNTHWPPWDWGCRCQAMPLTRTETVKMQHQDKDKPADQQRVLDDFAQADLTRSRRLVRNGVTYNVTAPREEGKPGAFTFHPADLRIDPAQLKQKYDPDIFTAFTKWAQKQVLSEPTDAGGAPVTVWDWMNGNISSGLLLPGTGGIMAAVTNSSQSTAGHHLPPPIPPLETKKPKAIEIARGLLGMQANASFEEVEKEFLSRNPDTATDEEIDVMRNVLALPANASPEEVRREWRGRRAHTRQRPPKS